MQRHGGPAVLVTTAATVPWAYLAAVAAAIIAAVLVASTTPSGSPDAHRWQCSTTCDNNRHVDVTWMR
jgi:hypothetical protein